MRRPSPLLSLLLIFALLGQIALPVWHGQMSLQRHLDTGQTLAPWARCGQGSASAALWTKMQAVAPAELLAVMSVPAPADEPSDGACPLCSIASTLAFGLLLLTLALLAGIQAAPWPDIRQPHFLAGWRQAYRARAPPLPQT